MQQRGIVDPSAPTAREIAAHNMKVMKCNLACEVVKALAGNPVLWRLAKQDPEGLEIFPVTPDEVSNFAIGVAESIVEKYSLMQDEEKGGLVS